MSSSFSSVLFHPRLRGLGSSLHASSVSSHPAFEPFDDSHYSDLRISESLACDDEFVQITRVDSPIQLDHLSERSTSSTSSVTPRLVADNSHLSSSSSSSIQTPPPASGPQRSRSLFSRLRSSSRSSTLDGKRPRFPAFFRSRTEAGPNSRIIHQFPTPPTHLPTPPPVRQSTASTNLAQSRIAPSGTSLRKFTSLARNVFATPLSEISGKNATASQLKRLLVTVSHLESTRPISPRIQPTRVAVELVDPVNLTASPFLYDSINPSTRTSFIPPSPSWFSRNLHPSLLQDTDLPTPVSLAPIPIPPPVILPHPQHRHSEVFAQIDNVSEHTLIGSPASASSAQYHSFPPSSRSDDKENDSSTSSSASSKPHEDSANQFVDDTVPTPISAYPSPPTILLRPPSTVVPRAANSYPALFIPEVTLSDAPDLSALPLDVELSLHNLFDEVGIPVKRDTMDYTGKQTDVIDFGGEANYEGHQWFQNAPSRPPPQTPSVPATPARHYEPPPQVIMQNESFEYALRVAPNVLYSRFKQYGQLGVLGWCSEFGEMIDNLKDLGFQGQMFVSTRTQALRTCEEILALQLPLEMQIIVMYLSSQVARMRRFLDGDRVFSDYPEPAFPVDPSRYGA